MEPKAELYEDGWYMVHIQDHFFFGRWTGVLGLKVSEKVSIKRFQRQLPNQRTRADQ